MNLEGGRAILKFDLFNDNDRSKYKMMLPSVVPVGPIQCSPLSKSPVHSFVSVASATHGIRMLSIPGINLG